MDKNIFYVYLHRRTSDNKVFYVGKGKNGRAWYFHNRNNYWNNVKNKHGVTVEIVFDHLSEEEALAVEKDTILEFSYFGYPLTNLTSGGESPVFSDESLLKMSISGKGRKRSKESIEKTAAGHKGQKRSEATCRNISNSLKGKKIPEERARRSALNRTGDKNSRYDKTTHTFINEEGEIFIGSRHDLCAKYSLSVKNIAKLFYSEPRATSQGWALLKGTNDNTT